MEPLPAGTSEDDVLAKLGEPQQRQMLGDDSQAWSYSRYTDEQQYGFVVATLKFKGNRLVDTQQYNYK